MGILWFCWLCFCRVPSLCCLLFTFAVSKPGGLIRDLRLQQQKWDLSVCNKKKVHVFIVIIVDKLGDEAQLHSSLGASGRWISYYPDEKCIFSPGSAPQFAWQGAFPGVLSNAGNPALPWLGSLHGLDVPSCHWQHPRGTWMRNCHHPPHWHHLLAFIKLFAKNNSF